MVVVGLLTGCGSGPDEEGIHDEAKVFHGPERKDPEEESKRARVEADFATIVTAADLFRIDRGRWPASLEELLSPPVGVDGEELPPYLHRSPRDPWSGRSYTFVRKGEGFELICLGSDETEGGEGYAADLVQPVQAR